MSASFPRVTDLAGTPIARGCALREVPRFGSTSTTPPSESAGNIFVEVAAADKPLTTTLAFDPSTRAYDTSLLEGTKRDGRVDLPGGAIHIRASGGKASTAVPAFDTTVRAAFALRLEEPAANAAISSTSGDLVLRWTDAGNQALIVNLWFGDEDLVCQFEPADGKGIVPAALLQKALAAERARAPIGAPGPSQALLSIYGMNTSTVASGDFDVSLTRSVIDGRTLRIE